MNKFLKISLLLIVCALYMRPTTMYSQAIYGNVGGEIVDINVCPCSFGLMLSILKFPLRVPTNVLYIPFESRLNANYNPFKIGNSVIVQHTGVPVPCLITLPTGCTANAKVLPGVGTVTSYPYAGIGTSLISPWLSI